MNNINNIFKAASLAALVVVCGCSVEATYDIEPEVQSFDHELILSAYIAESPDTKTSRDNDGKFFWSPGDAISLFYGSGSNGGSKFTATIDEPAQRTDFFGNINIVTGNLGEDADPPKFWAVYPYSTANECDGNGIVTEVPSSQIAAENTFADNQFVSIGSADGLYIGFYHVCGGIKFFLQEEGISRISLTGNAGETLAGTVSVAFDDNGLPAVQSIKSAAKEIVLTPPAGETSFSTDANYFFVTLPVTFSKGFTIAFEKEDGTYGVRSVNVTMTVNRAMFQWSESSLDTGVEFKAPGSFPEPEYQDIEKAAVREFLEDASISEKYENDPEYTISLKGSGVSSTPEPVKLSWNGTASQIVLSTSEDFAEIVKTVSATSSASVYNLIPDVTYYYRVTTSGGFILKEGCVIPKGPFRALSISGLSSANARDLGGWTTTDGYKVKYGKLFRGSAPSGSSTELYSLGATVEMDLRGYPSTSGGASSRSPYGAYFLNRPVCQFMYGESSNVQGVSADDYQQAIREIINYLYMGEGVFFHCIGGADRTGTLSWLILSLLGVNETDLCKEFELTSGRDRAGSTRFPFPQLPFYIKTFTQYEFGGEQDELDPETGDYYSGKVLEAKSLQDMTTFWALTQHEDENDGFGPFTPLTMNDIEWLKYLLLEGYTPDCSYFDEKGPSSLL